MHMPYFLSELPDLHIAVLAQLQHHTGGTLHVTLWLAVATVLHCAIMYIDYYVICR